MLWISGHDKLFFTDDDKAKLKQYVERGGTIIGEACCSKKEFDLSFRSLMSELWPEGRLAGLPLTHPIYDNPRPLREFKPKIEGMAVQANQGRLGVIYFPNGISCQWERGGTRAAPAFDVASNLFFYVDHVNHSKTPIELEREKAPATVPVPTPAPVDPVPPPAPVDPKPVDPVPADGVPPAVIPPVVPNP
jgi:hypothetical protein